MYIEIDKTRKIYMMKQIRRELTKMLNDPTEHFAIVENVATANSVNDSCEELADFFGMHDSLFFSHSAVPLPQRSCRFTALQTKA